MINKAKTIKEQFNLSIPRGNLYYPAAGSDMINALMYSIDSVSEAHFSDRMDLIIPYPDCGVNYKNNIPRVRVEQVETKRKTLGIIAKDIVKSVKEISVNSEIYITNYNNTLNKYFNFNPGVMRPNFIERVAEMWTLNTDEDIASEICIYTHKIDAVLMLMAIQNISIFFYRRDTDGEGGSEQYWFSPDLFNLLLYKMVDGGLIVTDGSNISPYPYRTDFPWSSFSEHNKIVDNFFYNDIRFQYIGKLNDDDVSKNTHVWQIHKKI